MAQPALALALWVAAGPGSAAAPAGDQPAPEVEHKFARHGEVKLHYAAAGEGPLVVFIHGFPDFWYTWRHQMEGLKTDYRVAAMDTRGYNRSDQPESPEAYRMNLLAGDVAAVIAAEGADDAVVVGHDWGGAIAWRVAMTRPELVNRLIIVNLPHPVGFMRELAHNPEQQKNSQYARNFQLPGSHLVLNAKLLAGIVGVEGPDRDRYIAAFERSSTVAMMNYYRQNYPRQPYQEIAGEVPPVTVPVLQFHGLKDTALHHHALDRTWELLARDYTLVTLPDAGHWAHHDEADLVTGTMVWWLRLRSDTGDLE